MHRKVEFDEPITITETGYIYVWVSNESENVRVWFDDLKITHRQSIVVQATDYGVWGDVIREQKTDQSVYRYGYQGQFAEKDEETGWNHFELREFDPVIGRWLIPDPKREHWSPYLAMGNNPVNILDPDGGCEKCKPDNISRIGDRDYWWDGEHLIPMGREVVFEEERLPPKYPLAELTPFVQFQVDAVNYKYVVAKGGRIFKDYSGGLYIYSSDGGGGGPGWKKRDPNQNPAAEGIDFSWWLKWFKGRDESQHGILTNNNEVQDSVHQPDPDTIIYTKKRLQVYTRDGEGAGVHFIYDAYTVDKTTGDTSDVDVGVIKN